MKAVNLVALSLIVTLAACAPPLAKPSPEIAATADRWEEGLNAGDLDALVALYTADARVLPPNAELGQGPGDVEASFAGMIEAGLKGQLDTIESVAAGDIGYRVGVYALMAPDGAVVDRGKFVETWRLVDGEWKITNDIWNSNIPVSAGETVVITHEVEDADRWLAAFRGDDSRRDYFAANAGVSKVRTFQNPDDPDLTALVLDIADTDAFESFLQSDEAKASKAEDGVKDSTMRVFVEVE